MTGGSDTASSDKVLVVAPQPSQGTLVYEKKSKSHDIKGEMDCKTYIKIAIKH